MDNYFKSNYTYEQIEQALSFVLNRVAPIYDASSTYKITDYVIYNGRLYQCIVAITTPEAWTAVHWEEQMIFDNNGYIIIKGK